MPQLPTIALGPPISLVPITVEVCEKATETTPSLLDYDGNDSYFDEDDLDSFWDQPGLEEALSDLECDEGK
jgi:hypothetical protein